MSLSHTRVKLQCKLPNVLTRVHTTKYANCSVQVSGGSRVQLPVGGDGAEESRILLAEANTFHCVNVRLNDAEWTNDSAGTHAATGAVTADVSADK